MYIRVKRQRSTIFLHVEPTETVLEVKQKVQQLTEQPAENQRLYLDGVNLDDAKTLAEVKVDNDAVLAVVFKLNAHKAELQREDYGGRHIRVGGISHDENATWEEIDIHTVGFDGLVHTGQGKDQATV